MRLTTPLMISPTRSLNSSYCRLRSYSRTRCTITCLAVCAAMRPKSIGGSGSTRCSPSLISGLNFLRDVDGDLGLLVLHRLHRLGPARQAHVAGLAVDRGADVLLVAVLGAAGLLDGLLHRFQDFLAVDVLLPRDGVGDQQQFRAGNGGVHSGLCSSWDEVGVAVAAISASVSTSLARRMASAAARPRCRRPAAAGPRLSSAPSTMPENRLRPSIGATVSARARWPAKRFQSLARVSGRSMPAELTSSDQAPGIGSSTSSTAPSAWLIASQSATVIWLPSARSAITCTVGRSRPSTATRTSS